MTKEIVLVSLIDGEELNLLKTKAFTDVSKAEEYFAQIIKEEFPDDCKDWNADEWNEVLSDGYFEDCTHFCVYINEITLEDDEQLTFSI